jgi:hypothetical protein
MTEMDHVFVGKDEYNMRVIVKLNQRQSVSGEIVLEAELLPMHDRFEITYNPQFKIDTSKEEILEEVKDFVKNLNFCGLCQSNYDVLCKCKDHMCGRCRYKYFKGAMCTCGWPIVMVDVLSESHKKRKI